MSNKHASFDVNPAWWHRLWNRFTGRPSKRGNAIDPAAIPGKGSEPDTQERAASLIDHDSPIRIPDEDRFGVDPFAAIVARSIAGQRDAEGTVIAINGPWGSGKSSVVNLTLHHLASAEGATTEIVHFNPWWFSGSAALASAFFQTIGAALNRTLKEEGREALGEFFERLGSFSTYADVASKAASTGIASGLARLAFGDRSIEGEHRKLADAIRAQPKRFVVVIDDIDRLSPEEALLVFGLVKSVGRLPRITYLLAFDRILIGRLIAERFPTEGSLYLEKIVQGMFDLPPPPADVLRQMLLDQAGELFDVEEADTTRFMNIFYDIVAPNLTSPRQVVRLNGALRVAWPSVAGEIDPADFLAIETLRLFHPALYRNVRQNPDIIRGHMRDEAQPIRAAKVEAALFRDLGAEHHEFAKTALQRLFPRLEAAWSNIHFGDDWDATWDLARYICSPKHFPTYFQYGLADGTLSNTLRADLITRASDGAFIGDTLLDGLAIKIRSGGTRAALILDELNIVAAQIAPADVPPLVTTLFAIADQLENDADQPRGFGLASNYRRLHWLINRLLLDSYPIEERSRLLRDAARTASTGWLIDLARRCLRSYQDEKEVKGTALVNEPTARALTALAVERIRTLGAKGQLIDLPSPAAALWFFQSTTEEGPAEVRVWTDRMLENDHDTVRLARAFTSTTWRQGLGDHVAQGIPQVGKRSLGELLDAKRLLARAQELLAAGRVDAGSAAILQRFERGWNRQDRHGPGDEE